MNYENLNDARKIQEYVTNMRPTFNKRAVFSDETENYRTPAEPEAGDTVNVRIRTKKNNVDFIFLVYDDVRQDRKSTRLNSSHVSISYAVFCLKKTRKRQCLITKHPI